MTTDTVRKTVRKTVDPEAGSAARAVARLVVVVLAAWSINLDPVWTAAVQGALEIGFICALIVAALRKGYGISWAQTARALCRPLVSVISLWGRDMTEAQLLAIVAGVEVTVQLFVQMWRRQVAEGGDGA